MSEQRQQTLRQDIIACLESGPMTVRQISQAVGIKEKDVYHHLSFIDRTLRARKKKLGIEPYACLNCGFEFKHRKSFKRPGRCPGCRNGRIASALFCIENKGD